ncbi:MAG: phasin [Pseudomonadota bacterium]|jgi:phasin
MTNNPFSATVVPFQVPESVRAMAEKGVSQARESYARFKEVAETGNGAIEAACHSATKGVSEYTTKVLDLTKTNTEAAFDFAHQLAGAQSVPAAFELWSAFVQHQFQALTAQTRELSELSQKIAAETVEPIKATAAKAFPKAG